MNRKSQNATWAFCLLSSFAFFTSANAATYEYTGNLFTDATSPYTTSDSISGSMSFAEPLADNLPALTDVTPSSWSFSDGVQTLTQANTAASPAPTFQVETDSSGDIVDWQVILTARSCLTSGGYCFVSTNTTSDDGQILLTPSTATSGIVNANPGTWSTVTATPLPAALPLIAGGVAVIGLFGLRKKDRRVLSEG
jgi:hypothetical protein